MNKQPFLWLMLVVVMAFFSSFIGCDDGGSKKEEPGNKQQYTVTIDSAAANARGGRVTAKPLSGPAGTEITVTIQLTDGFMLKPGSLQYDTTVINETSRRFKLPAANVVITAAFIVDDGPLQALIGTMTLDEKVGQMVQTQTTQLNAGDVADYFLGSVMIGGTQQPPASDGGNNPQGWVTMVNRFMAESLETRLGIPMIFGLDAVHGHSNLLDATILPHNIGLGAIAAGDRELGKAAGYAAGRITAEETLATGVRWSFSPCVGVAEDMRWGRTYECYSEDVDIVTIMGESVIRGLQENGVAGCIKHFLGEGQTTNGRNTGDALLDEAGIRRILPPYQAGLDAGVLTLMPSFSSIGGVRMHIHPLLNSLVKGEMNFQGFIISDWDAARADMISGANQKERLAKLVNAGVDMIMATHANNRNLWVSTITDLKANVADYNNNPATGISEDRIDDAVLRILRVKKTMGLWEQPMMTPGDFATQENRNTARRMVAQSLVLLKNENRTVQGLADATAILLAGQGGDDIGMQCGGWTITHQGGHGNNITRGVSIKAGIESKGKTVTVSATGTAATGTFDAIIAVIGETPYAEGNGDVSTSTASAPVPLRATDVTMLNNAYAVKERTGAPLIVIMLSGRPMDISSHVANWDAFIAAWLPGSEAGDGIADVLFDPNTNFVGKTPYAWREIEPNGTVIFDLFDGLRK